MARQDDLHQLSGAFALDAIDDEVEARRFVRHLEQCQACTSEVRKLREVATAMAFASEDFDPPRAMRDNVLAAVAHTRQLPPEVTPRRRRPSAATWTPRLVAVAAAAAAIVLGVQLANTQDQLTHSQAIAAVLAAPDARLVTGQASAGGRTTIIVSAALREVVATSTGLPALPANKVYELWLIGPSRVRPAGLVAGTAPVLAGGLAAGDKLGMTVEPAGGSQRPTTTPILLVQIS